MSTTQTADEMFAEALVALTSLRKSAATGAPGGTGLQAPALVEAFRKSATVDGSAPDSISAVARRLQLAHRVASLQRDAIVQGHLDFAREVGRRDAIVSNMQKAAVAQGTPEPTAEQVDAMLKRKRAIGPRWA
jgi:hypothetical protein